MHSFQGLEEKMMLTCTQLQDSVPNTVEYAKSSPERIGHAVSVAIIPYLFNFISIFFRVCSFHTKNRILLLILLLISKKFNMKETLVESYKVPLFGSHYEFVCLIFYIFFRLGYQTSKFGRSISRLCYWFCIQTSWRFTKANRIIGYFKNCLRIGCTTCVRNQRCWRQSQSSSPSSSS